MNRRVACQHFCRRPLALVSIGAGMFGWRATQVHAKITVKQLRTISHTVRVLVAVVEKASMDVLLNGDVGRATVLGEARE